MAFGIRSGLISSRVAVEALLGRLGAVNPIIKAVTAVHSKDALVQADEADCAVRRGDPLGLLHGVPFTTKENVDQAGAATTQGVVSLRGNIASTDSSSVANLRKAGAIMIGRTNMSPFAMRWHTDNDLHGPTFNPWSRDRTPGGSSGGGCRVARGRDYGSRPWQRLRRIDSIPRLLLRSSRHQAHGWESADI